MSDMLVTEDVQDDLLGRGFARRDLARIAAVFGVGAAAATLGRPAFASGGVPDRRQRMLDRAVHARPEGRRRDHRQRQSLFAA
jgi:hypothetical protein